MRQKHSSAKEYFVFSKSERNGIVVLAIIIILLTLSPYFYKSFFRTTPSINSDFYIMADSFFSSLTLKPDDSFKSPINAIENEEVEIKKIGKPHFFDPNIASVEEFVQLGLSVKQAQVIDRYRAKGGKFRNPVDFSKMYVIDSEMFKKLRPWIKIDELSLRDEKKSRKDSAINVNIAPLIVELNSADTLELTKIKGIGNVFARRIVAYRDLLGGYTDISQFREIYGMKEEMISKISPHLTIDSSKIKQINLNLVSYEDLKKHPYLSDYQAKSIIYYRSKVGNIKNLRELIDNKLLPLNKYNKIKRYLVVN